MYVCMYVCVHIYYILLLLSLSLSYLYYILYYLYLHISCIIVVVFLPSSFSWCVRFCTSPPLHLQGSPLLPLSDPFASTERLSSMHFFTKKANTKQASFKRKVNLGGVHMHSFSNFGSKYRPMSKYDTGVVGWWAGRPGPRSAWVGPGSVKMSLIGRIGSIK